jgi:hypothetical protein
MATLTSVRGRALAELGAAFALGPVAADVAAAPSDDLDQDLGASVAFPIGEAGDGCVITATGRVHVLFGASDVVATTACPAYSTPVRLIVPDGCTHVALLEAEADVSGGAYKG